MRILRWIMVAVGLALGVALLATGNLLIGGLVTVLAGLRAVMVLMVSRRQHAVRAGARPAPGAHRVAGAPGQVPGAPARLGRGRGGRAQRRLTEGAVQAAARTIGVDVADLRAGRSAGRSIAAQATERGVAPDRVVEAVVADAGIRIDRAEASGYVQGPRADYARAHLSEWATRLVHGDASLVD